MALRHFLMFKSHTLQAVTWTEWGLYFNSALLQAQAFGRLAQLVERPLSMREAEGSVRSTRPDPSLSDSHDHSRFPQCPQSLFFVDFSAQQIVETFEGGFFFFKKNSKKQVMKNRGKLTKVCRAIRT
jgi:hypothetical protein